MAKIILHFFVSCFVVTLLSPTAETGEEENLLDSSLSYYETLHHRDVHHAVTKRSLGCAEKTVSLKTLGRRFVLHLQCHRKLFAPDFHTRLVGHNNSEADVPFDVSDVFQGYVDGESRSSSVSAYWEEDNLVATIHTIHDTYYIEPSINHLPESDDYTMLAYRASDHKKQQDDPLLQHPGSFCGHVHDGVDDAAYYEMDDKIEDEDQPHKRGKRQTNPNYNTCQVTLVADYSFYKEVGKENYGSTAKYMINILSNVNTWYRRTNFAAKNGMTGYDGYGFEIKEIVIHDKDTNTGYNKQQSWDTNALLDAFGLGEWRDSCLAHLFTATQFTNGVLGLGWVAAPESYKVGGICSPVYQGKNYNSAWSTALNKNGARIITLEAQVVMAHEFGHNWGSSHDPAGSECSPGGSSGNYIMYTYAVSGYSDNNKLFSPCSKRAIGRVLASKAEGCFKARIGEYCGNYNVGGNEECDTGGVPDNCCTADCKLKGSSTCSDQNQECCKNCQAAVTSVTCRGDVLCTERTYCNGLTFDCPAADPKPDGTVCTGGGTCNGNGKCISYCESRNKTQCQCEDSNKKEDFCKFCCRGNDGICKPEEDDNFLPTGTPCIAGYCTAEGACESDISSVNDRIWDVIDNLSVNTIWIFIKDNLVLATIILSLIIYIPLCAIVAWLDHKNEKEEKDEADWLRSDNENLVKPEDSGRIRTTYVRRRPVMAPEGYDNRGASASAVRVEAF